MKLFKLSSSAVCCLVLLVVAGVVVGCTSSIADRRQARLDSYRTLSPAERAVVDGGLVQVGLAEDAVYIAWGKPTQVFATQNKGRNEVHWLYFQNVPVGSHYWTYRTVNGPQGPYVERRLKREYESVESLRAEVIFTDGKVARFSEPLQTSD